jgi:molybdopterin synthase catalytic subunit
MTMGEYDSSAARPASRPLVALRDETLSIDEAIAHVRRPGAGGIAVFIGTVRDENDGRPVVKLEYQAYASMAVAEMTRIADEVAREVEGVAVAVLHRTGELAVGDVAVVCAASAPHRGEAFAACRRLIDRIKARVPIWKREHGPEGAYWVGWEDARCAGEDDAHAHSHSNEDQSRERE